MTPLRGLGVVAPNPEQIIQSSIALAGLDRRSSVSVAGPSGLEAMIALCRDGFEHVECVRAATCACADEPCDGLLILGTPADELAGLLRRTCGLLEEGGVLVIELDSRALDDQVRAMLAASGLGVVEARFDTSAGCLARYVVRRASATLRKAG